MHENQVSGELCVLLETAEQLTRCPVFLSPLFLLHVFFSPYGPGPPGNCAALLYECYLHVRVPYHVLYTSFILLYFTAVRVRSREAQLLRVAQCPQISMCTLARFNDTLQSVRDRTVAHHKLWCLQLDVKGQCCLLTPILMHVGT